MASGSTIRGKSENLRLVYTELQWGGGQRWSREASCFVNVQDDQPLDQDSVDLINTFFTPTLPVVVGAEVDTWTVGGLELGAFEMDPDPNDGEDDEQLFSGVRYELALLSLDNTLFNHFSR